MATQIHGAQDIQSGTITHTQIAAAAAITLSQLADMATAKVLGRTTAGSGVIEELGTLPAAVQANITALGTIASGLWNGTKIGTVYGGTNLDTSGSTGVAQVAAGTWSVGLTLQNAVQDNITRLGTIASIGAPLGVTFGGTGTSTAFTAGSVVFAGASGVYSQDNTNLFWDDANNHLGIGGAPAVNITLNVLGTLSPPASASASGFIVSQIITPGVAGGNLSGMTFSNTFQTAASGVSLLAANIRVSIPTLTLVGTGTFTTGAAVWIEGAPTGATNNYALRVNAGLSSFGGDVNVGSLVRVGGTGSPGAGTNGIIIADGTPLSSMTSNTAGLYADDVSNTVNLFGINEVNEAYQITAGGAVTPRDYACGSFTIQTGRFVIASGLTLSSTQAITINGTGKLVLI